MDTLYPFEMWEYDQRIKFEWIDIFATVGTAVLILIFSFWLDLLPPALWQGPAYYILPVVTLSLRPLATVARLVRASCIEVLNNDFVRTARAKGLSSRKIFFKHVLRNSLISVLSIAGPLIAGLLSGSFVVEMIFAVPGLGRHLIESVSNRDYPFVLGLTILYSAVLIVSNLISDLLLSRVDPRIRVS